MLVKKQLNEKTIIMKFAKIVRISTTNIILVSETKLIQQKFERCYQIKKNVSNVKISNEKTSKTIDCEICAMFKMHRIV